MGGRHREDHPAGAGGAVPVEQILLTLARVNGEGFPAEEGGNPVPTGRMYLGTDMVQLDAYGCRLMGLQLEDVPYIQWAERWGAGSTQIEERDIVRLFKLPVMDRDYICDFDDADKIDPACYAALVRALYTTGGTGGIPVAIGQGWKGRTFEGLGIGRCCDCAAQQVKGCPPSVQDIIDAL